VAIKYLVDSNIFLEILLAQAKAEKCKSFLQEHRGSLYISDFSLHSVGVVVFRENKPSLFEKFLNDSLPQLTILTLSSQRYFTLLSFREQFQLDFDDSYQCSIAGEFGLTIATMDQDYSKVKEQQPIFFV